MAKDSNADEIFWIISGAITSIIFGVELAITWWRKRSWGSLMTQTLLGLISSIFWVVNGVSVHLFLTKDDNEMPWCDDFFIVAENIWFICYSINITYFIWGYHTASIQLHEN